MVKFTLLIIQGTLLVCFVWITTITAKAQVAIGQPVLGFTKACAGESFNSYEAEFVFTPETGFDDSNSFIIELSDANGDFSNPVEVYQSNTGEIVSSPASVFFSIPRDARGDDFRIRVKSTSPQVTGLPSQRFPAYFKLHDTPFTINGLVDTATFCESSGYLLTIDNPSEDGSTSPLTFDNLNYNWFKVLDATNSVWIGEGNSFVVFEEGNYFARTDYGDCSSNSFSNQVSVSFANNGEPANATITSSLASPFCSNGDGTILTTVDGDSHEWFRNDNLIEEATSNTYQTNESGTYAVIITNANCVSVGSIDIESLAGETSLNVPQLNYLQAGERLSVEVLTDFNNSSFEWFLNNEIIDGVTGSSYSATQAGNYTVIVSSAGECTSTVELFFEIRIVVDVSDVPNVVTPNNDGLNDTWMIPAEYLSGTNTKVVIVDSNGKQVLESNEYLNNWPENTENLGDGNQVFYFMITPETGGPLKGSITVIN